MPNEKEAERGAGKDNKGGPAVKCRCGCLPLKTEEVMGQEEGE